MAKIMIVEDDLDLSTPLEVMLKNEGYEVVSFANAEEALATIINDKPDLILLDIFTRSLHGAEFLKRLRDLPAGSNDSKVAIITNLDNDITRDKVTPYGVDAYIVKSKTSLQEIKELAKKILL